MRKLVVVVVILLVISLAGCARNDVFTDEFFNGVESMSWPTIGTLTGEQMDPVIHYLRELNLTRFDDFNENAEWTTGGLIVLGYADGKPKTLFITTESITVNIQGVICCYQAKGENIYQGLMEAFETGRQAG